MDIYNKLPIAYYTNKTNFRIVTQRSDNLAEIRVDGKCVFRLMSPNVNRLGTRVSIGIYDDSVADEELEKIVKPQCDKIMFYGGKDL